MKKYIIYSLIFIVLFEIIGWTYLSLTGPQINYVGLSVACLMMATEIILISLARK